MHAQLANAVAPFEIQFLFLTVSNMFLCRRSGAARRHGRLSGRCAAHVRGG